MRAQVEIFSIGNQGQGVGRDAAGNTYFVNGLFPGDVAEVEAEDHGKFREAIPVSLIRPSGERINPPCRYTAECGGCDWMEWSYQAQAAAKARLLEYTLARFQFDPKVIHPFAAAKTTGGYRTRVQVRSENGQTGFVKRRSHDIVDVERCYVAHPSVNQKLGEVR
jgi:23S rRNA (uracil1939-C5)-methyltransferase